MTDNEREVIRAVIKALQSDRDRLGRLKSAFASEVLRKHFVAFKPPHGGLDAMDQAAMILQGLIGDRIKSILD
jgi:hypothetical protein